MRVQNVADPVYAPNSKGGPKADPTRYPQVEVWEASGEFVHAAYTKRKDDDDFGQAGTLVRKVMDDAQRDRLVSNVVGVDPAELRVGMPVEVEFVAFDDDLTLPQFRPAETAARR